MVRNASLTPLTLPRRSRFNASYCLACAQVYGADDPEDEDERMLPPAAHAAGWRHNNSPPDSRGAGKGTGGGSHSHKFFPPAAADVDVPHGSKNLDKWGLSPAQADQVLRALQ